MELYEYLKGNMEYYNCNTVNLNSILKRLKQGEYIAQIINDYDLTDIEQMCINYSIESVFCYIRDI